MAMVYTVIYQIRKPHSGNPNPGQSGPGNDSIRGPFHAVCLAANPGADVARVLNANETLASGEVIDILRSQQSTAAGLNGVWS